MVIPREDFNIMVDQYQLAWLAGFIDGDGSIFASVISRKDYILQYQVRVSLSVAQSTKRHFLVLKIQKMLGCGTVRKRNDGISEFCIVGRIHLKRVLLQLMPFLILKKPQARLVLEIIEKLPYTKDPQKLCEACALVEKITLLTDGKKPHITYDKVVETLRSLGHDV